MISIDTIESTALCLMRRNQKGKDEIFIRRFRARFGVDPSSVLVLWSLLERHGQLDDSHNQSDSLERLFWTLEFLKSYASEEIQADKFGVDIKTYRKWIWIYVKAIANIAHHLVRNTNETIHI